MQRSFICSRGTVCSNLDEVLAVNFVAFFCQSEKCQGSTVERFPPSPYLPFTVINTSHLTSCDLANSCEDSWGQFVGVVSTRVFVRRSMCSDLVYVILFPQLLMVVHFKHHCNTYGSLAAYIVAFIVRMTGGEPMLGMPAWIHYPGWDGERQLFPFRTMAMIMSLVTLILVSWGTK